MTRIKPDSNAQLHLRICVPKTPSAGLSGAASYLQVTGSGYDIIVTVT